jgi:hypothetical protein
MHVSRPKIVSQGLVKFYTVEGRENFGLKTNIEVHQVIDPTYQTPKYTTYVINDTPNQLITPPPNHITNKHDSRVKPEITIKRTPGPYQH